MKVSDRFQERVREIFPNTAVLLEEGMNELFRHGDTVGLDHDDQVEHAGRIGILAGTIVASGGTAEQFIEQFENTILNEEW